jgi:hypothetical protein
MSMKYALMISMNLKIFDSLTPDERDALINGHGIPQKQLAESGELVSFHAWGQREGSSLVRVRDGFSEVTESPYQAADDFLSGYYVVECASDQRALELAASVPDAKVNVFEARPIPYEVGPDGN